MVSTYDPNLRITEQGTNDNPNTWGSILNQQVISLLCEAIAGVATVDCTGTSDVDISITTVNGGTDTARHAILQLTGLLGNDINFIVPAVEKLYIVHATQTGGIINVKAVGGSSSVPFAPNTSGAIYTNGTNTYAIGASSGTGLLAANNLSDLANIVTARTNLGLGSAALLTAGTAPNDAVQLTDAGKLPAVDGSLLTNVSGTPAGLGTAAYLNVGVAAGNVVQLNGSAQLPAVDGSLLTHINSSIAATSSKIVMGAVTKQYGYHVGTGASLSPIITFGTAFSGVPYSIQITSVGNGNGVWISSTIPPTASNFHTYSGATDEQGGQFDSSFYWEATGPT